jgi:hypothetical protein
VDAYRQLHPEGAKGRKGARSGLPDSFLNIARQGDWKERASAWDRHVERQAEAEYELKLKAFREKAFEMGQALMQQAEKMLAFPLSQQKTTKVTELPDGKTLVQEITIEPVRWKAGDIGRMATTATNLVCVAEGIRIKQILAEIDQEPEAATMERIREELRQYDERRAAEAKYRGRV